VQAIARKAGGVIHPFVRQRIIDLVQEAGESQSGVAKTFDVSPASVIF
jgi:transposase-like protein